MKISSTKFISTNLGQLIETLKHWVGIQQGQSYLMGKRCLFSFGWPTFWRWCCNKNNSWGRCFTTWTSLVPHIFLLCWLKLNLTLLLDQLTVETGSERWTLGIAVISVDAMACNRVLTPPPPRPPPQQKYPHSPKIFNPPPPVLKLFTPPSD